MTKIGILGAGSWGTALAVHAASAGCDVVLWARDPAFARELAASRRNDRYLPEVTFGPNIHPTADLGQVVAGRVLLVVVPSHAFREVIRRAFSEVREGRDMLVVSATKGIESDSLSRMSEIVREEGREAERDARFAVLSGPSFAAELAVGQPTAAVIASKDHDLAVELVQLLSTPRFRLYSTTDVVGVELGGAGKNVIAIGAGLVTGLGLGHNTLAALITRGLHEITRLGLACGGDQPTFSGLAGLGDLVLTCTGGLSRNRRTGIELAKGKSLEQVKKELGMVAEGILNSRSLTLLAQRLEIEMPITEQMMAVIYEGKEPRQAVEELMTRSLKSEVQL